MRYWAWLAFGMLLAAPIVWAQPLPGDDDQDGVANAVDACPDTPLSDLVDASGCSACDCEFDANDEFWTSRAAYLRCVVDAVRQRRVANAITHKEARAALRAARNSTCGNENLVRCCIMFANKPEGMCRVMDELRCDSDLLHVEDAEDLDIGSCLPNPCTQ